jgi:hypothetical protein
MQRFEDNGQALATHLARQGLEADSGRWKRRNFNYLWLERLLQAKRDIAAVVPPGASYILVNDDEWGDPQPVDGRHAISFLERNGEYWGPPADDAGAIDELERLRREGPRFIVFWWTCFWWLDNYVRLSEHLHSRFPCALRNDRLIVFDIASGETGDRVHTV